eukprot:gene15571-biopygen15744
MLDIEVLCVFFVLAWLPASPPGEAPPPPVPCSRSGAGPRDGIVLTRAQTHPYSRCGAAWRDRPSPTLLRVAPHPTPKREAHPAARLLAFDAS